MFRVLGIYNFALNPKKWSDGPSERISSHCGWRQKPIDLQSMSVLDVFLCTVLNCLVYYVAPKDIAFMPAPKLYVPSTLSTYYLLKSRYNT